MHKQPFTHSTAFALETSVAQKSTSLANSIASEYCPFSAPFRDNPFPTYARARKDLPVFYSQELSMWIVTRYDDITQIMKDAYTFSSVHNFSPTQPFAPEVLEVLSKGYPNLLILINSDPPDHTRYRHVLSAVLTKKRIALMDTAIKDISNKLVDTFIGNGKTDLVGYFNTYLPISVMGKMMGFPAEEIQTIHRLCSSIIRLLWWDSSLENKLVHAHDVVSLHHYLAANIEKRRAVPTDDMLSDLIHSTADDNNPLTTSELVSLSSLLFFATAGIVVKFLGNAQLLLLSHPAQMEMLKEKEELMTGFVEESIRMEPSLRAVVRTTQEDIKIGEISIPAGSRLLLHLASANRDEAHFVDPDSFDIRRGSHNSDHPSHSNHVGLGHGIHYCAGAPLGKLICRSAIQTLLERLPNLRIKTNESLEFEASLVYRGLQHLNVEWDSPA
jgi:cytochrome P450